MGGTSSSRLRNNYPQSMQGKIVLWSGSPTSYQARVGKSALLVQFVQGIFVEKYDPYYDDSFRKQMDVDGIINVHEFLEVNQSSYQFTAMLDLYIKNANGFLYVFDTSKMDSLKESELNEFILKIKTIKETETLTVPVILVGTKYDIPPDNFQSGESDLGGAGSTAGTQQEFIDFATKLAQKNGFPIHIVSSKTKVNIDKPFNEIISLMQIGVKAANEEEKTGKRKKGKN